LNPPDWVASPAKVMNLVMNCQEEKSPVFYFPKFGNFTRFFGPAGWSKIQIRKNGLAKILRILRAHRRESILPESSGGDRDVPQTGDLPAEFLREK